MKILNIPYAREIIHFFYPAYCLHCEDTIQKPHHLLCAACSDLLETIDRKERCPRCWGPEKCKKCFPLHPHRSLYEPTGPISALAKEYLRTKRPIPLAALIAMHLCKTSWPLPEKVVPQSKIERPLAKQVAAILGSSFSLAGPQIQDQTVLFISLNLANTSEFLAARRSLNTFFPLKVFSLAVLDTR